VIAVGGSQEVLNARPGSYQLVLKNRKGFIKLAIVTGASLVPVFSFGENEIFNQSSYKQGSVVRKLQECFKGITGVVVPLVKGRGFFQKSFGVIPLSVPISTVVGSPIEVKKNESPTAQEIDDLHSIFVEELRKLFDEHKGKYIEGSENVFLTIE
jgi:2-acylglycerol O-acyltransferase 2